jgi:hypothetical protein
MSAVLPAKSRTSLKADGTELLNDRVDMISRIVESFKRVEWLWLGYVDENIE